MKERPIIFNAEMVRAILEGRKTQTRRPIKAKHLQVLRDGRIETCNDGGFDVGVKYIKCPFGQPGDKLYVRETWCPTGKDGTFLYRADGKCEVAAWKPSIHMPRWASRIILEVTGVRVERVQEIDLHGVISDGTDTVDNNENRVGFTVGGVVKWSTHCYRKLWDSIYGESENRWIKNPWVWVIEFRMVK